MMRQLHGILRPYWQRRGSTRQPATGTVPGRFRARFEQLEPRWLLAFDPSAMEQAMLEDVNRFRTDPQGELDVLFTSLNPLFSSDRDVQGALSFFDVDSAALQSQWEELEPVPPVAWNELLADAAKSHNQMMIQFDEQSHQLPDELDIGDRIRDTGYPARGVAENIYAFGESTFQSHAGFIVDWGESPTGIQDPPGHRNTMMNDKVQEVGIAITPENDRRTSVGPLVVTQDFASRPGYLPQILGVVFDDISGNGRYDAGEGLAGVDIEVIGRDGTYRATTMTAGGYQLPVPKGTFTVIASGGGLSEPVAAVGVVMADDNVKVDFDSRDSLRPPTAADDTRSIREDVPATINVLANDSDVDGQLDRTSVVVTSLPSSGTVTVNRTTGAIRYQPNEDFFGTDTFGYRVLDNDGAISNEANVIVTVDDVNDKPVAEDDSFATDEDTPVVVDIVGNDTDVDGSIISRTVQIVSTPKDGNVRVDSSSGAVTYTPNPDFFGVDSFRYTVADDDRTISNLATVNINVREVNDPPVAGDDVGATSQDTPIVIDVAANDHDKDGIVSRNTVALTAFPDNGQVSVSSTTGVVTYAPQRGYFGVDSFRYVVLDNDLAISSEGKVTVFVAESAHPWRNPGEPLDVNGDGVVVPLDALLLVNDLNENRPRKLSVLAGEQQGPPPFLDTNGDGFISPVDVLLIVNLLNSQGLIESDDSNNVRAASSFMAPLSAAFDDAPATWPLVRGLSVQPDVIESTAAPRTSAHRANFRASTRSMSTPSRAMQAVMVEGQWSDVGQRDDSGAVNNNRRKPNIGFRVRHVEVAPWLLDSTVSTFAEEVTRTWWADGT